MLTIRPAAARGTTKLDWLDSKHTYSFGDYQDSKHHHFRTLRVINDDRILGGTGFGMHPHRDMEILTYAVNGSLAHQDSMGNGETIHTGEWQYMSAGTGVLHSEFNPSETGAAHFLQIWIMPNTRGVAPRYAQKSFQDAKPGTWVLVASLDGREGSIAVRQDVNLLQTKLNSGDEMTYTFAANRGGWLQVVQGKVHVNGQTLSAGDGLMIEDESTIALTTPDSGEVLLFDMA